MANIHIPRGWALPESAATSESAYLNRREFVVLGVLAIAVLLVGLWPAPLVDMMSVTVRELIVQVGQSKLAAGL